MQSKQLITLGEDGELALQLPNGSVQALSAWELRSQCYVYLVIDCSGSMAGNKLAQAKKGALDFAASAFRDGYAVGLVSFNDDVAHLSAPVTDLDSLTKAVTRLNVQGGTNLAPAINEVIDQFKDKKEATLAMVIVTDGLTNSPHVALSSAENAKRQGITILTIGTDDADATFLSRLASDTKLSKKVGSNYLETALSDVAKMLPSGQ